MNYRYKITLTGIKGFHRIYVVNPGNTLYMFHKQLRDDMEFPMDQPILFKSLDQAGNVVARYALIDLGFKTVDEVTIADTIKAGAVSFVYFYDIQGKKSVNVTLEGEETNACVSVPTLVDVKGPNPIDFENGYVAYEDLPEEQRHIHKPTGKFFKDEEDDEDEEDEDEDEDDEEDSDKEEEEIIYDANEGD